MGLEGSERMKSGEATGATLSRDRTSRDSTQIGMVRRAGRGPSRTCQAVGRRAFLGLGTLGMAGFTLGDLLAARAMGAGESAPARAVIVLWLWGGPSHLDTFDPKPDAPLEYRGPFESKV